MKNPPPPTPNPSADPAALAAWGFYNVQPDASGGVSYSTTPPPPAPTFDPYADPGYAGTASALTNQGTHAQANHDYQAGSYAQQYGYDSSGNLITDPSNPDFNPYSQAAILKTHYENATRGTANSGAASGQLYAGSEANAQNANTSNYNVSSDALQRAAQNAYHANDYSLQGTQDNSAIALAQMLGPAFAQFLAGQGGS